MSAIQIQLNPRLTHPIYFLAIFVLIWGSGQAVGILFMNLTPDVQTILLDKEKISTLDLVTSLIVGPIIETAILVYCILISGQIVKNKAISLLCAVIPICLLHALNFWQMTFIAIFPFFFQAVAYKRFREYWSVGKSMTAVAVLHSMTNLVTFYATGGLS